MSRFAVAVVLAVLCLPVMAEDVELRVEGVYRWDSSSATPRLVGRGVAELDRGEDPSHWLGSSELGGNSLLVLCGSGHP